MGSISSEEIISILKTEIENYDVVSQDQEVGNVIWVGDGIATVYGIEHAMYGEIVVFENGIHFMNTLCQFIPINTRHKLRLHN